MRFRNTLTPTHPQFTRIFGNFNMEHFCDKSDKMKKFGHIIIKPLIKPLLRTLHIDVQVYMSLKQRKMYIQ